MPTPRFRVEKRHPPTNSWAMKVRRGSAFRSRSRVSDAWFETPINDMWMAAYRLVPGVHREPVVAELRIFPSEEGSRRPPGQWSAEVLGIDAKVPEGGISADVIRRVRIGEHRRVGKQFWTWLVHRVRGNRPDPVAKGTVGRQGRKDSTPEPRRGRPPIYSDEFCARLAKEYIERVAQASDTPTADVARRHRLPASKMRDLLHQARKRGLLTEIGRGRPGGELTAKAKAILLSQHFVNAVMKPCLC